MRIRLDRVFRSASTPKMWGGIRDYIQEEFLSIFPGHAFDYEFVDEFHNQMYQEEKKMSSIILYVVIIANLVSWPVVYFVTRQWLQSFPYKVAPSILPYLAAMLVTIAIAYGSMLYHTFKASQINPADSLRHE